MCIRDRRRLMPIFLSSPSDATISARAHDDCFPAPPPREPLAFWASTKSLFLSCYLRRLITAHTSYQQSLPYLLLIISQQSDDLLYISQYFGDSSLGLNGKLIEYSAISTIPTEWYKKQKKRMNMSQTRWTSRSASYRLMQKDEAG